MQSAMLNARLCFIFSSQLHVSMHQNVDATNIGCHAYLTGFFHPTWAQRLWASARTVAGARLSRPERARRAAGSPAGPSAGAALLPGLPQSAPRAHARSPGAAPAPPAFGRAATGQFQRVGRGGTAKECSATTWSALTWRRPAASTCSSAEVSTWRTARWGFAR